MAEETALAVNSSDSNALATLQAAIGQNALQKDNAIFDSLAKSADYFGRLQLCGSNSKHFKKNLIPKAHYAYIVTEEDFTDLGLQIDIFPIAWRPKAIDMTGKTPVAIFDEKSPEFKEISERSFQQNSNCAYGPEFLVWIPAIGKFAGFFLGSKTARSEAKNVRELIGKGCTLNHVIIDNGTNIWEGITAKPCSTPFVLPAPEALTANINKFNAEAQAKAPEKAEQPSRAR